MYNVASLRTEFLKSKPLIEYQQTGKGPVTHNAYFSKQRERMDVILCICINFEANIDVIANVNFKCEQGFKCLTSASYLFPKVTKDHIFLKIHW